MALGTHWEWRGFGAVTPRFAQCFNQLSIHTEFHVVEDDYLWIPGLDVNAKFREGVEDGLKFKRKQQKEDSFEVWSEDPDELFEFPIQAPGWSMLREDLREAGLTLPGYPGSPQSRGETTEFLLDVGCKIVRVDKQRITARWEQGHDDILIEWAVITEPQRCISIGLENWAEDETEDLTTERALDSLRLARRKLDLEQEPLEPMNYLDAIKRWLDGACI